MPTTPIYTIGYGARDLKELLALLQANRIQYLLDVRSSPYSSYKPEFSKRSLQNFLEANGIRYVFIGDALGGQPDDDACYIDGKVAYEKVAIQPFYRQGIERVLNANSQGQRIVLMCSEGKPEICHRSKLIGKTLNDKGIEVLHIDEQDAIISQDDMFLRLTGGQPSLFGNDFFSFTSRRKYHDETGEADE